ncbi:MAG: hypothetical protein IT534_03315 [Bauldia sp.]|jgi:hypothetical protein|nr:hypothetical protein [Bauldia sp.]
MRRFLAAAFALALAPVAAFAQQPAAGETPPAITDRAEAEAFMGLFAGSWRADGNSRAALADPFEETRCNLTTIWDAATATLTNDGRCSTVRGRIDIDGSVTLLADLTLSGGFFSRFQNAELVNSTGQLYGDRFYVEATYLISQPNREPQNLTVQIWVSKPALQPDGRFAFGLIAQALDPATQQFVDVSNLVFVRSN